ncbi:MAG: glycosyltransferase family 4 protein, partial [Gammaproteobacteria bacterium]|nr:glycosyltransferase family 4 protein [candidate division Zixibacteria bacterium]NIR94032.1 glycosyltransferase family 4 protein [Gammaproteobacteria bacterium]NIS47336.1 glycosyltransferase family 4 protein [candidate division Zixibacteria bacterium]NIU15452.1 glycosyltransferase family 4 protein [candidate division Zixibacteria bacterium]NIV07541.1 glycosyltransferase [candidate division Zixibacteria bacterium]
AQGLDQILRTAHELQLHSSMKVRFVFVGDGPEKGKLIKFADELNLNNVVFLDAVEKYMMPKLVASADICLVPLKTYLPGAVPSKMYEAMASGKPVVLIAEGEAADCINSAQAGVAITPGDIQGLTQAITDMASDAEV